jgi:hypothetical protein
MFMAITRFKKSTYNYADCTGQVKHWRSASEVVIRAGSDFDVSWKPAYCSRGENFKCLLQSGCVVKKPIVTNPYREIIEKHTLPKYLQTGQITLIL